MRLIVLVVCIALFFAVVQKVTVKWEAECHAGDSFACTMVAK